MILRRIFTSSVTTLLAILIFAPIVALAETSEDIKVLQQEIQNKKAQVEQINNKLAEYKKRISEYANKAKTLEGDVAALENDTAIAELNVAATQTEIDSAALEMRVIDDRIAEETAKMQARKVMLKNTLFALRKNDRQTHAVAMLTGQNFNDVFRAATSLQTLLQSVKRELSAAQESARQLGEEKGRREQKISDLEDLQTQLEKNIRALEDKKSAKNILLSETQDSENTYRDLLADLRAEQQSISQRIENLTQDVERRLAEQSGSTSSGTPGAIVWPLHGVITTVFHDPTYPFRYLFEHSGLDIATPKGTPVVSAAPGIVAWAKTGKMYGNYIMVIHEGGMATLYAHLSRMDVKQDQYVNQGQVIGLSGGKAGDAGSGFSTGPHLHFEVRIDGIPVDPYSYLPSE